MRYTPTIGLEIHAELKTKTKMFCDSRNDPDEWRPNLNVCPVCMGFPGTLPVVNREAVRQVLRVGVAADAMIADYTEFDRKNYFYPDLPKGYQISQYAFPLVSGGAIAGVPLTRIHLEEDTARSQHDRDPEYSLVDFNRSGIPLMELVTEPAIHDAKTARFFAEELQRLLRALGASDANMEKGQMRVEANISISAADMLGTKVEVKNLNSFRSVERAIVHEIERQTEVLERGERVMQETRGWDEEKGVSVHQRSKEDSEDYRYFPDPDIPKFRLSRIAEFSHESLRASLPELPWQKRERYLSLGLKAHDAGTLVADERYASFFDAEVVARVSEPGDTERGAAYLLTDVRGRNPGDKALERLSGGAFAGVLELIRLGQMSSRGAKDLITALMEEGGEPLALAKKKGLLQMGDQEALEGLAEELILEHAQVVADIKGGKPEAMKHLLGQGMRKSQGSANPGELEKILRKKLLGP